PSIRPNRGLRLDRAITRCMDAPARSGRRQDGANRRAIHNISSRPAYNFVKRPTDTTQWLLRGQISRPRQVVSPMFFPDKESALASARALLRAGFSVSKITGPNFEMSHTSLMAFHQARELRRSIRHRPRGRRLRAYLRRRISTLGRSEQTARQGI